MPSIQPARGDLATARIEADGDATGVERTQIGHQFGVFDRRGPDDDALDPCEEALTRRLDAPDATPGLHLARHRRADRLDHAQIGALTGTRGVEIDDVDPLRAGGLELARDPNRVVVVDRLRVEVALVEPDAFPVAEVDRRVEPERNAQRLPLVDGTPVPSIFTASRNERATPLKDASITWCPLRPASERTCNVIPGREREGTPELFRELRVERADPLDHRVDLVDEEGAARQVEGHLDQRFVERHEGVGEPTHAGLVADRFLERGTEHDADVFDGVMEVDFEVAGGIDPQIEPGVLPELLEHVVEERDTRRCRGAPCAVDLEDEVDGCLLRDAVLF